MRARAPGKLVLSGAYAVLEGAPAIVTAVDRYVVADTDRTADFIAPEVRAALPNGPFPHLDVSELWRDGKKLGLGSSAAVVVASLAAVALAGSRGPDLDLAVEVCTLARAAHRAAQGGGSGIDVVASCFGGTRRCQLVNSELNHQPFSLPLGVQIDVYAAREPCVTKEMLAAVRLFASKQPATYGACMTSLCDAAIMAVQSTIASDFVGALAHQRLSLRRLGLLAGVPIVPDSLPSPTSPDLAILPSGAGGGDVVLVVGSAAAIEGERSHLFQAGFDLLPLHLDARGVHGW